MNIIGINGLGILPAVALISHGEIIAYAEEERFTRIKSSDGCMPVNAINYCIRVSGLTLDEIDCIAFGWDANKYTLYMPYFYLKQYLKNTSKINVEGGVKRVLRELVKYNPIKVRRDIYKMLKNANIYGKLPPIKFVSHHLSHAASSYYCSKFNESLILVVDGSGENMSTSIFEGKGREIKLLYSVELPNSLGWFYQCMTEYLGFTPNNHEGKLMALASYGKEQSSLNEKMKNILRSKDNGTYVHNSVYSFTGEHINGTVFSQELEDLLGPARKSHDPITQYHKDVAYNTQKMLEEVCLNLLKPWIDAPEFSGNLCLAGGVSLNCKLNGVLNQYPTVKRMFVPPHSSDNGVALGAALKIFNEKLYRNIKPVEHAYWGPEFSECEIEQILKDRNIDYKKCNNICQVSAELLAKGLVIGWFQGRMEVGARALGNRSILANPSDLKIRDHINSNIKNRELWRPFAASMLYEQKDEYVIGAKEAEFMTIAYHATDKFKQLAPATIHIDGTTRPQFVKKEMNPSYWNLIKCFGDITGIFALLNTSFNLKEEPIVCTPEQALNTFYESSLDALVIGDFYIEKK